MIFAIVLVSVEGFAFVLVSPPSAPPLCNTASVPVLALHHLHHRCSCCYPSPTAATVAITTTTTPSSSLKLARENFTRMSFNCETCGRSFPARRSLAGHYLSSERCRKTVIQGRAAAILGSSSPPPQDTFDDIPMDSSPIPQSPPLPRPASSAAGTPPSDGDEGGQDIPHGIMVEEYPNAGESKGFEKSLRKAEWEDLSRNEAAPYHPFSNFEEWEFSQWLLQSNISQGSIDKLLKLQWVCLCRAC